MLCSGLAGSHVPTQQSAPWGSSGSSESCHTSHVGPMLQQAATQASTVLAAGTAVSLPQIALPVEWKDVALHLPPGPSGSPRKKRQLKSNLTLSAASAGWRRAAASARRRSRTIQPPAPPLLPLI